MNTFNNNNNNGGATTFSTHGFSINNANALNTMTSGYCTSTNMSSSMTGSSIMSGSLTSSGVSSSGTISSLTSPHQPSSTSTNSPSSTSTMSISSPRHMEMRESSQYVSSSSVATLTPSGNRNENGIPFKNGNEYEQASESTKR